MLNCLNTTASATAEAENPCADDVMSTNHLLGFEEVEALAKTLVEVALDEGLSIRQEQREKIIQQFNNLQDYDKQLVPEKFVALYMHRFRSGKFCLSKYSSDERNKKNAAISQNLKLQNLQFRPAHHINEHKNRLVYTIIKIPFLSEHSLSKAGVPQKNIIFSHYDRLHKKVLTEDSLLCKLGIPLQSINSKVIYLLFGLSYGTWGGEGCVGLVGVHAWYMRVVILTFAILAQGVT